MDLGSGDLGLGVPIAVLGSLPSENCVAVDKNLAGDEGREEGFGLGISFNSCIGLVGRTLVEGLRGELGPDLAWSNDCRLKLNDLRRLLSAPSARALAAE